MITGIDHVQVAAPPGCEPAARSFYGGLLELAEVDKPEVLAARGGCWFAVGGQQLHVGGPSRSPRPPGPIPPCTWTTGLRSRRWRRGCKPAGSPWSGTT